jgi:hypothetical protein
MEKNTKNTNDENVKKEKFRILKRTYGSNAVVFIPQYLYFHVNDWYKNVCDEMGQTTNSFITEKEAREKIEEFKNYEKDSKIVSDEIIKIDGDDFITRLQKRINAPNQIGEIHSFASRLKLSEEQENEFIDILGNVIADSYMQNFVNKVDDLKTDELIGDLIFIHDALKNLTEGEKENILFVSLYHMKNNKKLSIQEAIENALFGFGYDKEE